MHNNDVETTRFLERHSFGNRVFPPINGFDEEKSYGDEMKMEKMKGDQN